MTIQRRWNVLICSAVVCAAVLGGVFVFGKGKEMNTARISVDHVSLTTDKPFEDVTRVFERQLGRFDPDVYKALAQGGDAKGAKAKMEAMAGPWIYALCHTQPRGAAAPRWAAAQGKGMDFFTSWTFIGIMAVGPGGRSAARSVAKPC
jgi:hypothetical protein